MTVDCFTYNGEQDILELRLKILDPHVDLFVIGESEITFSGKAKPLYFLKHSQRFAPYAHKIRYWVTESFYEKPILDMMAQQHDMNELAYPHKMAFYQKECLQLAITDLQDTDTVYYGDCDEIWKPKPAADTPYKLEQLSYSMYLNNRTTEPWKGTAVTTYKTVKQYGLNQIRQKTTDFHSNGGWHFSNMGGLEELRRKIHSYDHQEVNNKETHAKLEERYMSGSDFLGRSFAAILDESEWPAYLKENKQRYAYLCK